MRKIVIFIMAMFSILGVYGQEDELVRIKLEKGKTDILTINETKISEAYVYGNRENLIKFLINDRYLDHYHNTATVYNFTLADIKSFKDIDLNNLKTDENKVLIVTESKSDFNTIYDKLKSKEIISGKTDDLFKLAEVNNLNVFVSYSFIDTLFAKNSDVTWITLNDKISDAFQVEGTKIPIVKIYGTKENIIRFLINDKYIKHRMYGEGANYNFIKITDTTFFKSYFSNEQDKHNKILIAIKDNNEFLKLYNDFNNSNLKEVTPDLNIILDGVNDLQISVFPAFE